MQEIRNKVRVMSASEIARSRYPLKESDERRCVLGKSFEVGYSYISWLISKNCEPSDIFSSIKDHEVNKVGRIIDTDKEEDRDWLNDNDYQYCNGCNQSFNGDAFLFECEYNYFCAECYLKEMERVFFTKIENDVTKLSQSEKKYLKNLLYLFWKHNITGQTPPTKAKRHNNCIITAKPDLIKYDFDNLISEFKIYPLNNYAREQTKIFAWVFDNPICLYGVSPDFELQKETIYPPNNIGEIPELGELHDNEEICKYCNLPNCNCKPIYNDYENWAEE